MQTLRRLIRQTIKQWGIENGFSDSSKTDALADEVLSILFDKKTNTQVKSSKTKKFENRKHPEKKNITSRTKSANVSHFKYLKTKYQVYLNSSEWKEKAEAAKERAGYRCQLCNRSREIVRLEAHHRTYERVGDELPEDITVLCDECHEQFEMNTKHRPRDAFNDKARTNCDGCNASYEKWQLTKIGKLYLCPKCLKDIPTERISS